MDPQGPRPVASLLVPGQTGQAIFGVLLLSTALDVQGRWQELSLLRVAERSQAAKTAPA